MLKRTKYVIFGTIASSTNGEALLSSIVMSVIVAAAFLIGALIPVVSRPFSKELKGNVAAIAAGAYFSTISFSLVEESIKEGAFGSMSSYLIKQIFRYLLEVAFEPRSSCDVIEFCYYRA